MYGRAVACLKLKFNIMFCFNRIRSFAAIRMNTMSTLSTQHRELDHETYNSNLSNRNRDFKIFAFSAFKKIAKYLKSSLFIYSLKIPTQESCGFVGWGD